MGIRSPKESFLAIHFETFFEDQLRALYWTYDALVQDLSHYKK